VIVHGGGPQLTEVATRLGLETRFVDGLRVTDAETLDVATMVLAGWLDRAHLVDGRLQDALVLELFTREGIGTMGTADVPPVGPDVRAETS